MDDPIRLDKAVKEVMARGFADPDQARWIAEDELESEVERREERWRSIIGEDRREFADASIDTLDDPRVMRKIADWWSDPTRNLLLIGRIGTGKTYAAAAALRMAILAGWRGVWWESIELMDELKQWDRAEQVLERVKRAQILLLDDLGVGKPSEWSMDRLQTIIDRRWQARRPTIVTSNLDVKDGRGPFVEAVGQRVYDRLQHRAVRVRVVGASKRQPE